MTEKQEPTDSFEPRIWNFMPYCHHDEGDPKGRDLAYAYNLYAQLVPDDDWICFLDHDTCQTTRRWFRLLERAVEAKPDAGAFVAKTNRLVKEKSAWQMVGDELSQEDRMWRHWEVGNELYEKHKAELTDVTDIEEKTRYKPFSGFFFCIQKRTWDAIQPIRGKNGMSFVDYAVHRGIKSIGKRIYLIEGLYVYHWSKFRRDLSG